MEITMTLGISPQEAGKLVYSATSLLREELEELQRERLHEIVAYARQKSPYFREKYRFLSPTPDLTEIPVSIRSELASRFDAWVTDPAIKEAEVRAFIFDFANLTKPFKGYTVMTTSGTTGDPLIMLRDARHTAVHGALIQQRYLGGFCLKDVKGLESPQNLKSCGIISNKGFHSAYLSYLRMREQLKARGKEDHLILLPVDTPLHELERRLNEFKPDMIACYPSAMMTLVPARLSGQLDIHPKYIACSAEQLSEANRQLLSKTFGCPVINNYCSTEGGEIAMSCPEGHLHVNSDWVIVEPVDDDNMPAMPGTLSSGVLITNLANLVQPIIRYRLTDKVIWHDEPCGCGLRFPFIELQGREEEMLIFESDGRKVPISAPVMMLAALDMEGCNAAQFIQCSPSALELRMEAKHGFDWRVVGENLRQYIQTILEKNELNVQVTLSSEPFLRTKGGKFRVTCKEF
jgi:phenylacetate-coenzyme A ligase PaaK-like adenylate-forming protein